MCDDDWSVNAGALMLVVERAHGIHEIEWREWTSPMLEQVNDSTTLY
jgi:hypothetical protein